MHRRGTPRRAAASARRSGVVTALALVVAALSLSCSQAAGQGRKPGSVLIYPLHRSGPQWATIISVTNTNVTPQPTTTGIGISGLATGIYGFNATPIYTPFGGATNVRFAYTNVVPDPANPLRPTSSSTFGRTEFLSPADTLSVLTDCHNIPGPMGQQGWLTIAAEDPVQPGTAWSHDDLMGSALCLTTSGAMFSLNAVSLSSPLQRGLPTDTSPPNGMLDFNDQEYTALPDVLYLDSFAGEAHLTLVNLTGGPTAVNTVLLSVWNDNEMPLSTTIAFSCWFDQPLATVSSLFLPAFMQSLPNDPGELDITCDNVGDVETGWVRLQSLGVSTAGGILLAGDGALLGATRVGPEPTVSGARLLWESRATQANGSALYP